MLVVQAESNVLLYYNEKFFNVKGQESRVADWVNLYTSSCLEKNSRVVNCITRENSKVMVCTLI